MSKINKIINILFGCGWSLFFIFSFYIYAQTYTTENNFSQIYQSEYSLYFGLLLWSALSIFKNKFMYPVIWLILIFKIPENAFSQLPEIYFHGQMEICFEDRLCDDLIKNSIACLETGQGVWDYEQNICRKDCWHWDKENGRYKHTKEQ